MNKPLINGLLNARKKNFWRFKPPVIGKTLFLVGDEQQLVGRDTFITGDSSKELQSVMSC